MISVFSRALTATKISIAITLVVLPRIALAGSLKGFNASNFSPYRAETPNPQAEMVAPSNSELVSPTFQNFSLFLPPNIELPPLNPEALLPSVSTPLISDSLAQKLHEYARSITVKVLSAQGWGSGIIIQRQGQLYTVVTNEHVLNNQERSYQIQTPDGRIYEAVEDPNINFPDRDLALLQFQSTDVEYEVAVLGDSSTLKEGDGTIAVGFPFHPDRAIDTGFKFTAGRISLVAEKSLVDGYQVGYTNEVEKGMSGGPVLNFEGQVIAINGMHAHPLWGDPYIYQDGSRPCPQMREIMERSSWAIPIQTFLQSAPQLHLTAIAKTPAPSPPSMPVTAPSSNTAALGNSPTLPREVLQIRQQAEEAKLCSTAPVSTNSEI
jgi:S1-C subfamily serine protease